MILHFHHEVRSFVNEVRKKQVHTVRHAKEFLVANMLQNTGDTHGWHLDDPEMALVIFFKTPGHNAGGELEYIPEWDQLCKERKIRSDDNTDQSIIDLNAHDLIKRESHKPGDAYLLNASKLLHRVSPITASGAERWVINMAFDTRKHIEFGDTADLLYN